MTTFSNADYSGPFSSRYEEHQALEGSSGNRAAHTAAQAVHSRGLRALEKQGKGPGDTSLYGTNENPVMRMLNMPKAAQFTDPITQNPMYNYGRQPEPQSPSQDSLGMQETFGMGLANIASGGAFSSDPNVKMQNFLQQGFSQDQTQRYIDDTARTKARLAQERFLYGDRANEIGTRATQETTATGDPITDPTTDPNYIPPHLRYLMEQRRRGEVGIPQPMNMGGIVALGPVMQQQQYEMGRQMAMGDMGKSV